MKRLVYLFVAAYFFLVTGSVSSKEYAHIVHETMWADYLSYDKKHAAATDWYHDSMSGHELPYPLRSYVHLLFQTQQYTALLKYKQQLQFHFHHDLKIQQALAIALVHNKSMDEAERLFMRLAEAFPTAYEAVIPAVQFLMQRDEHLRAQNMLEKLVNTPAQTKLTPIAYVLLAQIHLKNMNINEAYAIACQCTHAYATYVPAWIIRGSIEELLNNKQAALESYKTFCALSPVPVPHIEQRIRVLSGTQHDKGASALVTIMREAIECVTNKRYHNAQVLLRVGLQQQPYNAYMRALYIHALVMDGMSEQALAILMRYIAEDPDDHRWWGALHLMVTQPMTHKSAYATLQTARRAYPSSIWGYLYEGDCALRSGQYKTAYDLYTQAYVITRDDTVRAELCFMQALCGYEKDDYTLVADALKRGLSITSLVHAPLYNIAAYYYAHHGDYARAQQLATQCCTLEPHNYHYQDTVAFIAYKQGNFAAADTLITALYAAHTDDATITLHNVRTAHKKNKSIQSHQLLAHAHTHAYSEYQKRRIQSLLHGGIVEDGTQ